MAACCPRTDCSSLEGNCRARPCVWLAPGLIEAAVDLQGECKTWECLTTAAQHIQTLTWNADLRLGSSIIKDQVGSTLGTSTNRAIIILSTNVTRSRRNCSDKWNATRGQPATGSRNARDMLVNWFYGTKERLGPNGLVGTKSQPSIHSMRAGEVWQGFLCCERLQPTNFKKGDSIWSPWWNCIHLEPIIKRQVGFGGALGFGCLQ